MTQMSIYKINIQVLIYSYHEILHSNEKEESNTIHYNIDEFHRYNAGQKKPDTKECILYDSIFTKFENRQN